jgi:cyclomaltodextrinase
MMNDEFKTRGGTLPHSSFIIHHSSFLCVVVAAFLASVRVAAAEPVIRVAGTFNQWRPDDPATLMTRQADGTFVLEHFFDVGTYELKFVADGNWSTNWGDGGGDRLSRTGGNLQLAVPRPGPYCLVADIERNRWSCREAELKRPLAVPALRGGGYVGIPQWLDGSASRAAGGKRIESYRWRQADSDPVRAIIDHAVSDKPRSRITFPEPGTYHVALSVSDGTPGEPRTLEIDARIGYSVTTVPISPTGTVPISPDNSGGVMVPIAGGRLARVLMAEKPGRYTVVVRTLGGDDTAVAALPADVRAGRSYTAILDPHMHKLTIDEGISTGFRYRPADDAGLPANTPIRKVFLAGTFNGWSPSSTPMTEVADGEFYVAMKLPEGLHQYKFVVNGMLWREDPRADPRWRVSDGRNGHNSGVFVGPHGEDFGPPKPNHVNTDALFHDPGQIHYFNVIGDDLLEVRCRTLANDVQHVTLVAASPGGQQHWPMQKARTQYGFDYWAVRVANPPVVDGGFHYVFEAKDGTALATLRPPPEAHRDEFRQSIQPAFATPDWAQHAVWYQILVSRFRNGDPSNDRMPRVPWTWNWLKPFGQEAEIDPRTRGTAYYRHIWFRHYGGDIAGLREKLPYLRDLGVNALYLLPMFTAESEHKYDASDYRHIDDSYGVKDALSRISGETDDPATWKWSASDKLFLDFLADAHRQGFRIIVDVSFNHVGRQHYAFQDVLKNGRKSRYADWFDIADWGPPIKWRAWDGDNGSLPNFRRDAGGLAPPVRDHIFAVTRRWMDPNGDGDPSDGIDGWRLDVANLIPAPFWREWRKLVKSINPDAYLTAEIWTEAREWLAGDQFDAVMNYEFAKRMQRFFVNQKTAIPASQFAEAMADIVMWYPTQSSLVVQNLLDSHDTDRFASMMVNPDLPWDERNRVQDNNPKYNLRPPTDEEYRRVKLAHVVQFTFVGAPMIWYGDEVGMWGADDPHCRKPMVWKDLEPYDDPAEHVRQDMLDHYRRLIAIRNTYPALQLGELKFVLADDATNTLAYVRALGAQYVLVVINNSDKEQVAKVPTDAPDGTAFFDLLSPKAASLGASPAGTSSPSATPAPAAQASATAVSAVPERATAHPRIQLLAEAVPAARAQGGKFTLTLPARSGAILVPRE